MNRQRVSKTDTSSRTLTRSLSPALARIVTELELDQAFLVTIEDLERIRVEAEVRTSARLLAKRLRDRGWLLPTEQVGVWEFAPGSHAGPIGRGHPFRAVQAAIRADPELEVAVCLGSALWARGLLDKTPAHPEVALKKNETTPASLRKAARVVHFDWRLPTQKLRGTPTHTLATVLVHLAARPSEVKSWSPILETLPELLEQTRVEDIHTELKGRPGAVKTRLAYLVHGIDPALAFQLAPESHGKVWFGPRGRLKRHNQRFNLADTVLPISPAQLKPWEKPK
jgi:predicted transcriptional regulator of viral defense system